MSEPAIRVERLGKRYHLGRATRYKTFRESLTHAVLAPVRRLRKERGATRESLLWALREVSFEVMKGETVGIIGPNGAGKSTLLKILSRITEPTEGRALIWGRIGSLLEVGTGFHNELTGRENIYLNGAILGMKRAEIDGKFDEIVAFSELEPFLDTPVKHYSSGMYMRLAFAVAAHLEPDILLVDEVLAVGDATFQRKCLGKMDDVAKAGRTVLFVSHDMRVIKALCRTALYLQGGRLLIHGPVREAIDAYVDTIEPTETALPVRSEDVVVHAFEVTQDGKQASQIDGSFPFYVTVDFEVLRDLTLFRIGVAVRSASGETILRSLLADWDPSRENVKRGRYRARLELPEDFLIQGPYRVVLHSSRYGIVDYLHRFNIEGLIHVMGPHRFNQAHMQERVDFAVVLKNDWRVVEQEERGSSEGRLSPAVGQSGQVEE